MANLMKACFLWLFSVRKISVASNRWFLSMTLCEEQAQRGQHEEAARLGVECLAAHFFAFHATSGTLRRKTSHCPLSRKRSVREAWTIISGRMNCGCVKAGQVSDDVEAAADMLSVLGAHLVELVAEVDWVDVVAFEVREHDDVEDHGKEERGRDEDREEVEPSYKDSGAKTWGVSIRCCVGCDGDSAPSPGILTD